jgi:hypothetical protein
MLYPKKVGKEPAEKSWRKLSVSDRISVIEKVPIQYQHTAKQFVPNPATYLNQKRWEDEIISGNSQHEKHQRDNQPESNHARICRQTREAIEATTE